MRCESGFRQNVESHATFELTGDTSYLLIPMTYRRNVSMPYEIEVYCDQPVGSHLRGSSNLRLAAAHPHPPLMPHPPTADASPTHR